MMPQKKGYRPIFHAMSSDISFIFILTLRCRMGFRTISLFLRILSTAGQSSSFTFKAQLQDERFYHFNETTTEFSVTVSHPIRINGTVTVNVDRVGSGKGCTALSDSITNVTIALPSEAKYQGSSVTVTCQKKQASFY